MSESDRTHESEHASPRHQMTTGESPDLHPTGSTLCPHFTCPPGWPGSRLDSGLVLEQSTDMYGRADDRIIQLAV
jgi:hypothetical protein